MATAHPVLCTPGSGSILANRTMNDRLRHLPPYPSVVLAEQRRLLREKGRRVFDFGTGDPADPVPEAFERALIAALPEASQHPGVAGLPELRLAVADYLHQRFGVRMDPDREILPTLGSKEALFHLPMSLVQVPSDKDLVLYGEPGYPVYEIAALFAEAWTYALPLVPQTGFCMDPDLVPEATLRRAAVVFLNHPHNPTGRCLRDDLFARWIAAREEFGFVLVSDECYADLWFDGPRPRSLLEFGTKGCLVVHSLSKRSGMAGYRSGFLAGDADLLAHYGRFRVAMGTTPQAFVQAASAMAWRDQEHVELRRVAYARKRRLLLDHFARIGLQAHGEAGPFLWLEVPSDSDDVDYAARCFEHGILVARGSFFGANQQRFVRVALLPSLDDCGQALDLWPR